MPWLIAAAVAAGAMKYAGADKAAQAGNDTNRDIMQRRDDAQNYLHSIDPEILKSLNPDELNQLQNAYTGLSYTPEQYAALDRIPPEDYEKPADIQANQVQDSPQGRNIQAQALSELQQRSEQGLSAKDQYEYEKNKEAAGETARGREQAITQNMAARGMGGSGMEAALRNQGSQESTNRLADVSAQQAQADALSRIQATQDSMQGGAALRAGDVNLNTTNANILNQFAQLNAQRQMQVSNMNTQQRNSALDKYQDLQQQAANLNTQGNNQAKLQNNAYTAAGRESGNQNLLTQYSAQQNALDNYYNANAAQQERLSAGEIGYIPDIAAHGAQKEGYAAMPWLTGANTIGSVANIYGAGTNWGQAGSAVSNANLPRSSGQQLPASNENGLVVFQQPQQQKELWEV